MVWLDSISNSTGQTSMAADAWIVNQRDKERRGVQIGVFIVMSLV